MMLPRKAMGKNLRAITGKIKQLIRENVWKAMGKNLRTITGKIKQLIMENVCKVMGTIGSEKI